MNLRWTDATGTGLSIVARCVMALGCAMVGAPGAAFAVTITQTSVGARYDFGYFPDDPLEDSGPTSAQVGDPGSLPWIFGKQGASGSVAASGRGIRIEARYTASSQGGSSLSDHRPDQAAIGADADFTVSSPTNYLLSLSGWNLREEQLSNSTRVIVSLGPEFGTEFGGTTMSGPLVQPFSASASGQLAPGDYRLGVQLFGNAYPLHISDGPEGPYTVGDTAASQLDLLLGFGENLESIANGLLLFDAAAPGTVSSSFATTTDLASVVSSSAASAFSFALPGTQAQVWQVDFSGSLEGAATLRLEYDESLLDVAEESLAVAHFDADTDTWQLLPAVVDADQNFVTVQTPSFSPFVLVVPEPGTAALLALGLLGIRSRRGPRARRDDGTPPSRFAASGCTAGRSSIPEVDR